MEFQTNYALSLLNTLHLDCSAEYFVVLNNTIDLSQIKYFIDSNNLKFFVLGGGSNLILPEKYIGLVISNQLKGINLIREDKEYVILKVMSGEVWDEFVDYTLSNNWFGLENLSLIPGTVGAAPIQNIGAYGVEVKDFIVNVEVYDTVKNTFMVLNYSECNFSYRNSIFKTKPNYIVTAVTFKLRKQAKLNISYGDLTKELSIFAEPTAHNLRDAVIKIRQQKLPDPKIIGNVGSFFHNPILPNTKVTELKNKYANLPVYPIDDNYSKVSAGWLIDNLGLKGYKIGNIGVYPKQALVLVNYAEATKKEIIELASFIQNQVFKMYQIHLNIEPIIV